MPSTARQLRQPPTIEAIGRVPYFADEVVMVYKDFNRIITSHIIISLVFYYCNYRKQLLVIRYIMLLYKSCFP